ncbi:hypothetical protein DDB_G0292684 [Dictyostelium discoideum AX4]|uniref:Uncharacterized protein n=1 Tax=Dictyostelium discoideum TaxID=44689 RepID=Q54CV1_DICDI|nr:hypothetical protein DDB_G0292684 [Dictyostelium discoideum AX4]EAL61145.1 hypothetical protein DDB_G0292684 [Dictyostelium discoideum AX4]|eukprot:XP_629569.1 hypothetical protein DDB_G0292684 [Dictyostelium discoideum AX4]
MSLIAMRIMKENQLKTNLQLIENSLKIENKNDLKINKDIENKQFKNNYKYNNHNLFYLTNNEYFSKETKNNIEINIEKIGNKLNDIKEIISSKNDWSIDEISLKNIYFNLLPKKLKDMFGLVLVDILENIYKTLKRNCQNPNILKIVQKQSINNQIIFKIESFYDDDDDDDDDDDHEKLNSNNDNNILNSNKSICNLSFEFGNLIILFKSIKNINIQLMDFNT